jgi:hypothetical protein
VDDIVIQIRFIGVTYCRNISTVALYSSIIFVKSMLILIITKYFISFNIELVLRTLHFDCYCYMSSARSLVAAILTINTIKCLFVNN